METNIVVKQIQELADLRATLTERDTRIAELEEKLRQEQYNHTLWKGIATRRHDILKVAINDELHSLEVKAGYFQLLTATCREWLQQAPRFMELGLEDDIGSLTVTIRARETPTPQQLLKAAEERVQQLEKLEWGIAHNAGRVSTRNMPRWAHVSDAVGCGSTSAQELCRRQGVDPDELVGGDSDE